MSSLHPFEAKWPQISFLQQVQTLIYNPYLGTPADTSVVTTEGDTLVFDGHIPKVLVGLADVHSLDGLSCLTGVLELNKAI